MNHLGLSATYFTAPGYGNFGVTIGGYDSSTAQIQVISHCIGLGMAVLSFPLAMFICHDMFWVRRRHLFVKRKDRYRASDSAKHLWKRLPNVVQSVATVFLWPLFYSPQANECLVTFMAIDNLAVLTWHILMLTDTGSFTLRSMVYAMCPVFSSGSLLLHLVGIMRAIPVSSKTSLFVSQGSRWQGLLFRLKVPSPSILTAVVFVYALVHIPLSVSQAWRLGSAANWPEMVHTFQLYWNQWALWLALFSITATIYGLQLIWLLKLNAKDRKTLARGGDDGIHGDQTLPVPAVPSATSSAHQKLVVATTKMVPRSMSGKLSPATPSATPATLSLAVNDAATATSSAATKLDEEFSSTSTTSSMHATSAPDTSSSPSALFATVSSPLSSPTVPVRKRPPATVTEAQRTRSLKQVKQILIDSPAVTMLYVPIHIVMVIAYGELATNPQVVRSWRFIVPVVANILAYAGAHLKVFLPLFFVVWRDKRSRLVGKARMGKASGKNQG